MADRRNLSTPWRTGGPDPLRELTRLQRGVERIFGNLYSLFPNMLEEEGNVAFSPPVEFEETESHFRMSFDLPGMSKDDAKIEIRDNQLMISGERKREEKREGAPLSTERAYGWFQRVITLPSAVDADKVEANFENGVLMLTIPKAESTKPKIIPIREGKLLKEEKQEKAGQPEKEVKPEKAA